VPVEALRAAIAGLRREVAEARPLAGDASTRQFFRLHLTDGATYVACLYPEGREHHARHDAATQRWCLSAQLPVPDLVGRWGRVVVSEDLGPADLATAHPPASGLVAAILAAVGAFQRHGWRAAPNAPFDARLLRRELAVFEAFATTGEAASRTYLDGLAARVARHPFCLVHRDFHVNNLHWDGSAVRAVDFQDLRGGPDTYDLVSFLRERGGRALIAEPAEICAEAAARLRWGVGWQDRFWECAAQRGLKVLGTFLRLVAAGRSGYGTLLPEARAATGEALEVVGAPGALRRAVAQAGL